MHEDWTTKRREQVELEWSSPNGRLGPPRLVSLWHAKHPFCGGWSLSRKQLHMNLHEPLPFHPPDAERSGSKERNIPLKNSAPARPRRDWNSELCSRWAHGRRRLISDEKSGNNGQTPKQHSLWFGLKGKTIGKSTSTWENVQQQL